MPPRHHHGGFGPRFYGGGGYFAPPSYAYPPAYYEPSYVPVFIVEDEEDRRRKEAEKRKAAASGLGIFAAKPPLRGLGVVVGNTTYDPAVYKVQVFLSSLLKSRGYLTIGTDGKLGAETCGAVAWLMQGGASDLNKGIDFDLNTVPAEVWQVWNVCASSSQTPPTPATAAAKTSSYNVAVTQIAATVVNPDAVRSAQNALNVALAAAGMCAIGVDGDAGPETCGAQTWLIANAGGDGLTQSQRDAISKKCSTSSKTAPSACPSATVAPVVAPVVPPTPPPAPPAPLKPKMSTASMVMGAGIAAVAVGGLYYYFKHKGGG